MGGEREEDANAAAAAAAAANEMQRRELTAELRAKVAPEGLPLEVRDRLHRPAQRGQLPPQRWGVVLVTRSLATKMGSGVSDKKP